MRDTEVNQLASLRSLKMNWGLRPCWVHNSLHEGVRFLRRFPRLQTLTLLVKFKNVDLGEAVTLLKYTVKSENHELRVIAAMVKAEFKKQSCQDPGWEPPSLRVVRSS
jgi:hypothetical protein